MVVLDDLDVKSLLVSELHSVPYAPGRSAPESTENDRES